MTSVPETDARAVRDLTIIGAGPVGLSAAFWAGMRQASVRIVDSLPEVGGQLTALYPEKWIFDVPGHRRILARDLVAELREQALEQFDVPVWLGTTAGSLRREGGVLVLETDRGELRSRAIVVSGGHGSVEPRRLPASDADMAPWEGRGAHYVVREKAALAGKRVVVVGGGDSAFDWVLNLLGTARRITLVHRREGFRAHEATVAEVRRAAEAGRVDLRVPAVIRAVHGNGSVEAVELHDPTDPSAAPERVACDAVLLQLGFTSRLGPLADWGFELDRGSAIRVDPLMRTTVDGVWACGDVTAFDGKLKLIATGFAEAAVAVSQAVASFRPDMVLQPGYSTDTGVPEPVGA